MPAHQRTLSVELADKVASATHAIPCSAVTCVLHAKEILDHGHVKAPDMHGMESKKLLERMYIAGPLLVVVRTINSDLAYKPKHAVLKGRRQTMTRVTIKYQPCLI